MEGCEAPPAGRGYCKKHYKRWKANGDPTVTLNPGLSMTPQERFWIKVDKDGPVPDCAPHLGPCWVWTAGKFEDGYAIFQLHGKLKKAHCVTYEWAHGPVPGELVLDHLCRNRSCVNPFHLEPVTQQINVHRGTSFAAANSQKTHCPAGHEYDEANTHVSKSGRRSCRKCGAERMRQKRAAERAKRQIAA